MKSKLNWDTYSCFEVFQSSKWFFIWTARNVRLKNDKYIVFATDSFKWKDFQISQPRKKIIILVWCKCSSVRKIRTEQMMKEVKNIIRDNFNGRFKIYLRRYDAKISSSRFQTKKSGFFFLFVFFMYCLMYYIKILFTQKYSKVGIFTGFLADLEYLCDGFE